ncbi:MAG: DUF202 domain-containing protein [Oscillatoria princeps RMCB-10]|jgi:putative membrane protein|nr:DUF202 domain-containing protein [Oscillatoria princeps RMCB-10]
MSNPPQIDRQREHQANERTFLAWLRTSIALIGFGFAIARFGLFLRELESAVTGQYVRGQPVINSQTLGVGLVILGIFLIGLSAWRYNRVFWQIERGDYRPNRLIIWITAASVAIFGLLSIPFVLWQRPPAPRTPPSPRSGRHSRLPNRNVFFNPRSQPETGNENKRE